MLLEIHSTEELTGFGQITETLEPVTSNDPTYPSLPKRYVYSVTDIGEIERILAESIIKDTGFMKTGGITYWSETSSGLLLWFFPFKISRK